MLDECANINRSGFGIFERKKKKEKWSVLNSAGVRFIHLIPYSLCFFSQSLWNVHEKRQFFRFCLCSIAAIFNTLDQTKQICVIWVPGQIDRISYSIFIRDWRDLKRTGCVCIILTNCLRHASSITCKIAIESTRSLMSMMDICKSSNEIYLAFCCFLLENTHFYLFKFFSFFLPLIILYLNSFRFIFVVVLVVAVAALRAQKVKPKQVRI